MVLNILNQINGIVWGPWLLILLVGTGILMTVRLRGLQFHHLKSALKLIFSARNKGSGDIDSFKALCTALAATVGTGNIVGVATAIKLGGPGALFWMWIAALFGMATKYTEGVLAVKYREVDAKGQISGGPMYYIEKGLGKNETLGSHVCYIRYTYGNAGKRYIYTSKCDNFIIASYIQCTVMARKYFAYNTCSDNNIGRN